MALVRKSLLPFAGSPSFDMSVEKTALKAGAAMSHELTFFSEPVEAQNWNPNYF